MPKLSVALIAKNEEETIERCLSGLTWADEIVILDGYSTDKTVEICRKYTDKIYQKSFESFPVERNYILGKTTHSWVLSIDADMHFPPEICQEIQELMKADISYDGFLMRGLTVFLDKGIRHCSWFDWRYLRLFNKERGAYDLRYSVLDLFYVKGKKGRLKNHFVHYAKEDFIDYFGKIKRISYLTALEYKMKGLRLTSWNIGFFLLIKPLLIFIYKYVYKRGFLDGVPGLIVCINSAISYYVAYAALWDIQRKGEREDIGKVKS